MAPFVVWALGTGLQVDPPDAEVPTAIERALMDRACSGTETVTAESYAHKRCLDAKLLSLRADFGRDLNRLSATDRRRIDTACSRLRAADQREAYLDCLSAQLTMLHNRLTRGKTTAPDETAGVSTAAADVSNASPSPVHQPSSSGRGPTVFAAVLAGLLVVVGVGFVVRRSRRTAHLCRVCGVAVAESELCAACRHEAAEALRRAALERAQNQKAHDEEERRQHEVEAEQREQQARDAEATRLREEEIVRQRQAEEELRRQAPQPPIDAAPAAIAIKMQPEVFDPYAVLGVPSEAGLDAIRAAYQSAITKYDPELVSYLGTDAQAHFREKAQSIERAYQMLSEGRA